MKRYVLLASLLVVLLSACGAPATAGVTDVPAPVASVTEPAPVVASPVAPTAAPTSAPTAGSAPSAVSFANDIQPILNSRCVNCHGVEDVKEGLDLRSYAALMRGSQNGAVVVAGNATDSLLYSLSASGKMPKRGPKLTPSQEQLIQDWINAGALDN